LTSIFNYFDNREGEVMVVNSALNSPKYSVRVAEKLALNRFFDLQVEQLLDREPIFFARIVFCHDPTNQQQEIVRYSQNADPHSSQLRPGFSPDLITYLRSETWLVDYPPAFTVTEIALDNSPSFGYFCPWGYTNNRPEYIQVIADRPLPANSQQYLQRSAVLLKEYRQLYLDWTAQKAESKLLEETIQNISHQLRNSLSLISLCAKNLWFSLKDGPAPAQVQAQGICDGIQNLDVTLAESILRSRDHPTAGSPSPGLRLLPQDLRELVNESIKNLQPLIQQKNLNISISAPAAFIPIDRSQMQQVFDNLLSNAVHFSPVGGTISCTWQIFQKELLINISDEGAGLSPADLQNIFTPFYSRREGGTGLGLTIAKKIVVSHHGSLWAQNIRSGGARFSLILPR
jgi:signal transduction histidine kinase